MKIGTDDYGRPLLKIVEIGSDWYKTTLEATFSFLFEKDGQIKLFKTAYICRSKVAYIYTYIELQIVFIPPVDGFC